MPSHSVAPSIFSDAATTVVPARQSQSMTHPEYEEAAAAPVLPRSGTPSPSAIFDNHPHVFVFGQGHGRPQAVPAVEPAAAAVADPDVVGDLLSFARSAISKQVLDTTVSRVYSKRQAVRKGTPAANAAPSTKFVTRHEKPPVSASSVPGGVHPDVVPFTVPSKASTPAEAGLPGGGVVSPEESPAESPELPLIYGSGEGHAAASGGGGRAVSTSSSSAYSHGDTFSSIPSDREALLQGRPGIPFGNEPFTSEIPGEGSSTTDTHERPRFPSIDATIEPEPQSRFTRRDAPSGGPRAGYEPHHFERPDVDQLARVFDDPRRPPLLRSISEDIVVKHRTGQSLPGASEAHAVHPQSYNKPRVTASKSPAPVGVDTSVPLADAQRQARSFLFPSSAYRLVNLSSAVAALRESSQASSEISKHATGTGAESRAEVDAARALATHQSPQGHSAGSRATVPLRSDNSGRDAQDKGSPCLSEKPSNATHPSRPTLASGSTGPHAAPSLSGLRPFSGRSSIDVTPHHMFDPATADAVRRAALLIRPTSALLQALARNAKTARSSSCSDASVYAGLMGSCGNGHFGNAIRDKAREMLWQCLPGCLGAQQSDTISIVEYGTRNTLSPALVRPIVAKLLSLRKDLYLPGDSEELFCPSWTVMHAVEPGDDVRPLARLQDLPNSEACYVNLAPNIFPSYSARAATEKVAPPRSVDVGYSLMDLHARPSMLMGSMSVPSAAQSELRTFLDVRAQEFKRDGLLILAFIQEADGASGSPTSATGSVGSPLAADAEGARPHSSPPSGEAPQTLRTTPPVPLSPASAFGFQAQKHPAKLWSTMSQLLIPCVQRLVSKGSIRSDTARLLLTLPVQPRSPEQTSAVLREVEQLWRVEWSCGLSESAEEEGTENRGQSEPTTPTPPPLDRSVDGSASPSPPRTAHVEEGTTYDEGDDATAKFTGIAVAASDQKVGALSQDQGGDMSSSSARVCEGSLLLSHPAYTAFQATTLSRVQFAEHAAHFIKILYEAHFRAILKDFAKLSLSKVEEVLDYLNEAICEKIEDPKRPVLPLEVEVCMLALRRL